MSRVSIEVYQHEAGIQIMVGDERTGYRLSGPKFDGTGRLLARAYLDEDGAKQVIRYAEKVLTPERGPTT